MQKESDDGFTWLIFAWINERLSFLDAVTLNGTAFVWKSCRSQGWVVA